MTQQLVRSPLSAAIDNGTLSDYLARRGSRANHGRNWARLKRLGTGFDSLTEGTPTSYTQGVTDLVGHEAATRAKFATLIDTSVSNLVGLTNISAVGDRSVAPRTYSWDGRGLYAAAAVGGMFRFLPLVSAGVQMEWAKCRLFYLRQPGGGTFDFRQYSGDGTSGPITSVNTAGTLSIEYIEITKKQGCTQAYVEASNVTGAVAFFALLFMQTTDDSFSAMQAEGGTSVQEWARLDPTMQRRWLELLDLDCYLLNGGTNDAAGRTAAQFEADLRAIVTNMQAAPNPPHVIVVEPTQASTYAANNAKDYAAVYRRVASDLKCGFWSMQRVLGSYATAAAGLGMEADGIHPKPAAALAAGYSLASELCLSKPNQNFTVFSAGGTGAGGAVVDQHKVDASTWRSDGKQLTSAVTAEVLRLAMGGAYVMAYIDVDVAVRVRPGVEYFIERTIRMYARSGATPGAVSLSTLSNTVKATLVGGGWAGLALTLTASVDVGQIKLEASANFDTQVYVKVSDVRVVLGGGAGVAPVYLVSVI